MILDWNGAPLSTGLACYRATQFFEAHEQWESVWLQLNDPEKSFLQALIQITAAMHHLRNGNGAGAVSLLRRSLKRLATCPSFFEGIDVQTLRLEVSACLEAIGRESQTENIFHPNIDPIVARPE